MEFVSSRWARALPAALFVALLAGCAGLQSTLGVGGADGAWPALLAELRAFERSIGFVDTGNFTRLSTQQQSYPFCGQASRLVLPYSYEDPAIEWRLHVTENECRMRGHEADVYFGESEAQGEIASPVTASMISGNLDRFIYLVIHEDCHDQFELPYGIEEALCELIAYKAMPVFAAHRYGTDTLEYREVRRYAETQSGVTRATILYYEQLAALYARYERAEIPPEVLLRERAAIFRDARNPLRRTLGEVNNVFIANRMTYSRHYPLMESIFDALGRDVGRTVAFFRQVDRAKPSSASVIKRLGIVSKHSVEYLRGKEAAVVEVIRKTLAETVSVHRTGL